MNAKHMMLIFKLILRNTISYKYLIVLIILTLIWVISVYIFDYEALLPELIWALIGIVFIDNILSIDELFLEHRWKEKINSLMDWVKWIIEKIEEDEKSFTIKLSQENKELDELAPWILNTQNYQEYIKNKLKREINRWETLMNTYMRYLDSLVVKKLDDLINNSKWLQLFYYILTQEEWVTYSSSTIQAIFEVIMSDINDLNNVLNN